HTRSPSRRSGVCGARSALSWRPTRGPALAPPTPQPPPTRTRCTATTVCSPPLPATDGQKQRSLVPRASGKVLGAYGLTEPGAGSDAGGTRTTARLEDDWRVTAGSKTLIIY